MTVITTAFDLSAFSSNDFLTDFVKPGRTRTTTFSAKRMYDHKKTLDIHGQVDWGWNQYVRAQGRIQRDVHDTRLVLGSASLSYQNKHVIHGQLIQNYVRNWSVRGDGLLMFKNINTFITSQEALNTVIALREHQRESLNA